MLLQFLHTLHHGKFFAECWKTAKAPRTKPSTACCPWSANFSLADSEIITGFGGQPSSTELVRNHNESGHRRALAPLIAILFSVTGLQAARGEPLDLDPFVLASSFLVEEAYQAFNQGVPTLSSAERKFGLGISLMNIQPRTEKNLLLALDLFNEVSAELPPRTPLNGLARLLRARLREFYLTQPDRAAARADYLALINESSGDPVVEMAGARLVILEAFADAPEADNLARLEKLEKLAPLLRSTAGRREFHTAMAYALLDNNGDMNRALDHFLAADREGLTSHASALRLYLVAGDTAAQAGRKSEAIYFYRKLIGTYPRDTRVHMVKERLRKLEEGGENG
jgi:hypothetical protein